MAMQFPSLWSTEPSRPQSVLGAMGSATPSLRVYTSSSTGDTSGSAMGGTIAQMAQGMASMMAGQSATGEEKPERPLRPTATTPSGRNYKDPRMAAPSFMGGSGRFDDDSHGANVLGQLAARTTPPAPPTGGGGSSGGGSGGGSSGGGSGGHGHGHHGRGWGGRGLLGGLLGRRWWR